MRWRQTGISSLWVRICGSMHNQLGSWRSFMVCFPEDSPVLMVAKRPQTSRYLLQQVPSTGFSIVLWISLERFTKTHQACVGLLTAETPVYRNFVR